MLFFALYQLFFFGFGYYGILCFIQNFNLSKGIINSILILLIVTPWLLHQNQIFDRVESFAPSLDVTYDVDKFSNAYNIPLFLGIALIILTFFFSLKRNWVILILPLVLVMLAWNITIPMIWDSFTSTDNYILDIGKMNLVYFFCSAASTVAFSGYCLGLGKRKHSL